MITRIEIDGFKTFSDFKMEFTPFTIVAGANASGKSNLFDALNLLSNLADKDIRIAFNNLRGDAEEQFTQFTTTDFADEIKLAVEMLVDNTVKDNWGEEAILKYTRMRYEINIKRIKNSKGFEDLIVTWEWLRPLKINEDRWIKRFISKKFIDSWRPKTAGRSIPYISTDEKKNVFKVHQDSKDGESKKGRPREFIRGSAKQTVLSSISNVEFPHALAVKKEMQNWRFFQLNPEDLRKPSSRMASDIVSHSGANLAAALYRLKQEDKTVLTDISTELNNLLPNFTKVDIIEDVSENRFVIKLLSDDGREFTSRVLSEGTLRILILCILKYDNQHKGIICFEEPENGIHPFRLDMMIQLLKGLSTEFSDIEEPLLPLKQMIVNTHSAGFVQKIIKESPTCNNKEISIWFSKLVSKVSPINKRNYKVTKLLPVLHSSGQYTFDFLEPSEIAMTELEVERYLEKTDFGI